MLKDGFSLEPSKKTISRRKNKQESLLTTDMASLGGNHASLSDLHINQEKEQIVDWLRQIGLKVLKEIKKNT